MKERWRDRVRELREFYLGESSEFFTFASPFFHMFLFAIFSISEMSIGILRFWFVLGVFMGFG
jgi:hypothetical protein